MMFFVETMCTSSLQEFRENHCFIFTIILPFLFLHKNVTECLI